MSTTSAARVRSRATEQFPSADATSDADGYAAGAPENRSWAGSIVGGITIGAAFVLGAAIIYRYLLIALLHVR
jgi:hypothetical protein